MVLIAIRYNDPCATPTSTPTPIHTPTATVTATLGPVLVGHVIWQGRSIQPDARQRFPITLTLKLGMTEMNYPTQTTDASGFFTVPVGGLANGIYDWRAKGHYNPSSRGPSFLAQSGTVPLAGEPIANLEIGLMRAGDADDDNAVEAQGPAPLHFGMVRNAFGCLPFCWDPRADFDGDTFINIVDFNLLKINYGFDGSPPISPARPYP